MAVNYQDLFEQKRYNEAIDELQRELKLEANDEKRSLLAFCYFIIGYYENALRTLQQIEYPTNVDYEVWADIHWHSQKWDEMAIALRYAQRISPSAYTYYRLAVAEGRGRYPYQIDAASKEIMQSYLIKAIELEECPVEAYLLLVDLYEFEHLENRVNTLNKAFQKYPDNATVRLELASMLIYRKGEYEKAIVLLSPLLGSDNFDRRSRWYIFEALVLQKKYTEAVQYLDGIIIDDEGFISRIKADLLFRQGKLGEWLASSAEYVDSINVESVIRHYFQKAYVNLQKNNLEQAVNDFKSGAELSLGSDISLDNLLYAGTFTDNLIYQEFDVITDVCETLVLLKDETEVITQKITGLLVYIIQKHISQEQQEQLLQFFPESSESLLLFAAKLLEFPASLGHELAQEVLDKNISQAIRYYLNYAIWKCETEEYIVNAFAEKLHNQQEDKFNDETLKEVSLIEEIVLDELIKCKDSELILNVFVPFYNIFWRKLLFKTNSFSAVAEISKKIVVASRSLEGLFDYAYSMNCLGDQDEATVAYLDLINQQPGNSAALNNLGVIYERKNMLDEAFLLFSQASEINPSNQIYSSNFKRLKSRIDVRNKSLHQFRDVVEKVSAKAANFGLPEEELTELNELYWKSDVTIKFIQEKFDLKRYGSSNIYNFVFPETVDEKCPNCFIDLVYKSRSAKASQDKICLGCGHKSTGWCNCEYCKKVQEEQRKQAERIRYQSALEEFNKLKEQYCRHEYVEWAIIKLSRREKIFLKAFMEVIQNSDKPTWEEICERAGVVSQKNYVEKLKKLKLLLVNPTNQLLINSAVELSMLEIESVRKISPSIRFDVFQRDNHTCQYCGRTPPEVKLVVDHLIPVAQGGTDIFENLVTSCEECNSGKSDKLIKDFTGGFNKEEWSKHIRSKRLDILQKRRDKLNEIQQHWTSLLGRRSLSERDNTAIYSFIESYEPDWIKLAIDIAVKKGIKDYVKYTAGILRNWAKDGPPEHLSNPDGGLTNKSATPKQIAYIGSLLKRSGLSLSDVSDKTDFNELTMLDARNLISALTEEVEE